MRGHFGFRKAIIVSVLIISLGATCPDAAQLRPVGHLGGFVDAVATDGSAVYAGIGGTVTRLTSASHPTRSGWGLMRGDGHIRDIAILGQRLYVAQQGGGLRVVGIGTGVSEVGSVVNGAENAQGVAAANGYVFLAVQDYGLRIYNATAPATPQEVGSLPMPATAYEVWDVDVEGDIAYVAAGGYGIWMVDVSNPASPVHAGYLDTGNVYAVEVEPGWIYAASGQSGLSVAEILGPGLAVERDSYPTAPHDARDVAVAGDVAWIAAGDVLAIDVSSPNDLTLLGSCAVPGGAIGIAASGDHAWAAAAQRGVQAIFLSPGGTPSITGAYDTLDTVYDIVSDGGVAHVAAGDRGLIEFDAAGGAATILGRLDTGVEYAQAVVTTPGRAWVGTTHGDVWDGSLVLVDISNPQAPVEIGRYHAFAPVEGLAVREPYAYLAVKASDGLRTIELSGSAPPYVLSEVGDCSSWWPGAYAYDIELEGDLAVVGTDLGGVQLVDVSTPTSPARASSFNVVYSLKEVAVDGRWVWAREAQGSTVRVLSLDLGSVTAPLDPPIWAGTWYPAAIPGEPGCCRGGLALSDDILYAAFDGWGLKTASVVDPDNLVEGLGFDTPLPATAVAKVGQRIWVGTEGGGLLVLENALFVDGFESGTFGNWSAWTGGA
jgi:hypothetical protein